MKKIKPSVPKHRKIPVISVDRAFSKRDFDKVQKSLSRKIRKMKPI